MAKERNPVYNTGRLLIFVIAICFAFHDDKGVASGFVIPVTSRHAVLPLLMTTASPRMGELTEPEQKVYDVLHELHQSKYLFRSVVVGKTGAILESTALLPVLNISQQPSTGANLLTLASEDKSFELHLTLNKVSKIVFVTRETPDKVMRLVRLLNAEGDSMCSLILATSGEDKDAASWFDGLVEKFGNEVQL